MPNVSENLFQQVLNKHISQNHACFTLSLKITENCDTDTVNLCTLKQLHTYIKIREDMCIFEQMNYNRKTKYYNCINNEKLVEV